MNSPSQPIIDYYETCEIDYKLLWDLNQSCAMHAGYWDSTTKTLRDALRRENEILADLAEIQAGDRVLDAGCGIGGSSFFLAGERHAIVTGITISQKQVDTATELAKKKNLSPLPTFYRRDFTQTGFANESFDVVWAMESVCHAHSKKDFIQEAFRLLRPNGRLVVADGFVIPRPLSSEEEKEMKIWLNGWGCEALDCVESFGLALQESGFETIAYRDITPHVIPSSRKLFRYSIPALCLSKLGEWVGLRTSTQTQNIWGAFYQHRTLIKRLWHYGLFSARKPATTSSSQ